VSRSLELIRIDDCDERSLAAAADEVAVAQARARFDVASRHRR
jgi:hypothetical protein